MAKTVSIRELSRCTGAVLRDLRASKETAVVTERGKPLAFVVPTDEESWEDFIIAHAPEIVRSLEKATAELRAGKTRSAREFFDELAAESSPTDDEKSSTH